MINYSDKSDYELGCMVGQIIMPSIKTWFKDGPSNSVANGFDEDGVHQIQFDINNPACSWNLMVDNGIDLKLFPVSKSYCASCHDDYEIYVLNEKPGRAVAICFLMIKGGM